MPIVLRSNWWAREVRFHGWEAHRQHDGLIGPGDIRDGLPVEDMPDLAGSSRGGHLVIVRIALIQTDGQIKAWHNDLGFATLPYGYTVIIATGFTDPARVRFMDLNDDGRAEIALIQTDGRKKAWHNYKGFDTLAYGAAQTIATDFLDPARTVFI